MSRVAPRLLALAALALAARAAQADTALRFERPELGSTSARVLDASGRRVGEARFEAEALASGGVRLRARTRLDSGAGSETEALLAPAEARDQLKLVRERSRTFAAGGALAVEARIDHAGRRAECSGSASQGGSLALPEGARVANTPVPLLLRPLATTAQRRLELEVVVCRGAPRLLAMRAERKRAPDWSPRAGAVEVEYGPSGLMGALAGLVSPRASFWFDARDAGAWIAHRLPLEPGGAPVTVVREGVGPPP